MWYFINATTTDNNKNNNDNTAASTVTATAITNPGPLIALPLIPLM